VGQAHFFFDGTRAEEADVTASIDLAGLQATLESVVLPVIQSHGLTLVDLEVRGGARRMAVRMYVDKLGGVTVGDCQALSREVGDVIDVSNLVPGSYDLEVSSPGLDRELRKERELRWAAGRPVRVWTREPVGDRREFTGRLVVVDEGALTLATAEGDCRVPRALVTKARLEVEP
jgi:ribosome maturation factor RimP